MTSFSDRVKTKAAFDERRYAHDSRDIQCGAEDENARLRPLLDLLGRALGVLESLRAEAETVMDDPSHTHADTLEQCKQVLATLTEANRLLEEE